MPVDTRQEGKEAELRQWLQSLDSLLDIRYIPWAERYCIVCKWPQADIRWPLFQSGEIGEPYDSLGWLCKDPGDASSIPLNLDECENMVIERLASCDNERKGWKSRMGDTIKHNKDTKKNRQKEALDQAEEVMSSLHYMAGHNDTHKMESIMREVGTGVI